MKRFFQSIQAHPWRTFLTALVPFGLAGAIYGPQARSSPFVVEGDTTAFSFTARAQVEDAIQAGIFASSARPITLAVFCSSLKRVGENGPGIVCPDGHLQVEHVAISTVRLGENTQVELLVHEKDLSITLIQRGTEPSLITLFADERTRIAGSHTSVPAGDWTVENAGLTKKLILLDPHLDPAGDEGGQSLVEGSDTAFEHDGRSGFTGENNALHLLNLNHDGSKVTLDDDRLQIYGVANGRLRTLRAVIANHQVHALGPIVDQGQLRTLQAVDAQDGSLKSLHVKVSGTSARIQLLNTATSDQGEKLYEGENRAPTWFEWTADMLNISLSSFLGMVLGVPGFLVAIGGWWQARHGKSNQP